MQTITTTYFGPGNRRASRIVAKTTSGIRRSFSYEHGLSADKNHAQAARLLATELAWDGEWTGGSLNNNSEVWVRRIPLGDRNDYAPIFKVEVRS